MIDKEIEKPRPGPRAPNEARQLPIKVIKATLTKLAGYLSNRSCDSKPLAMNIVPIYTTWYITIYTINGDTNTGVNHRRHSETYAMRIARSDDSDRQNRKWPHGQAMSGKQYVGAI